MNVTSITVRLGGRPWLLALWALLISPTALRADTVAIIPVHGEINEILADSVERRVNEARRDGARVLVFEMNTPGGLVTSAMRICRLIKNLPADVRTVAWVNSEAYSAGAMISLACNEIIMSRSSSIGDCAPILMSPVGPEGDIPERLAAKIESPLLQEFRDSAQKNGYDLLLSRAMVKWEIEVWWLENTETGERRFVETEEKDRLMGKPAPRAAEALDDVGDAEETEAVEATASAAVGPWRLIETLDDPVTQTPIRLEQPIDRNDTLLTLSQSEAVAFGFARAIVSTTDELRAYLESPTTPRLYQESGWERFAIWLNGPLVRGLLFVVFIIGAYMEFQSPGLIFPGVTAAIALIIFLAAPYAAGLADVWTLVLLVLGLGFLAVELFVLPGFGIMGLIGIGLLGISFLGTFVPTDPGSTPFTLPTTLGAWAALKTGVIVMSSSVIIAVVGIALLARYLPHAPLLGGMTLANPAEAVLGGGTVNNTPMVGDVGVVSGDLRPAGQARFGHDIVDVTSQGEYVPSGCKVQVIKLEGMNIVVRPLPPEAQA